MSLKSADFTELASIMHKTKMYTLHEYGSEPIAPEILNSFLNAFLRELNSHYFTRMSIPEMTAIIWPSTPPDKYDEVSEARIASLVLLAQSDP